MSTTSATAHEKTKIMYQGSEAMPVMTVKDYSFDIVSQFTCLGCTVCDNAALDTELAWEKNRKRPPQPALPNCCTYLVHVSLHSLYTVFPSVRYTWAKQKNYVWFRSHTLKKLGSVGRI